MRDPSKARSLFDDRVDIVEGDLGNDASLRRAFEGVNKLFLVNSGPQIPVRDEIAADAAKAAGVRHLGNFPRWTCNMGWLSASGVPFTFIQPTGFMSNLLAWARAIKTEGIVRSSTGDGRRAFIHSSDIAAVATKVLMTHEYEGKSLAITGPDALTFGEVTAKIGAAIGRQLTFQPISDEEARQRYSAVSGSAEETEAHVALWRAIREGRLGAVTDNVEGVLGRKPVPLDQWLRENADAFR